MTLSHFPGETSIRLPQISPRTPAMTTSERTARTGDVQIRPPGEPRSGQIRTFRVLASHTGQPEPTSSIVSGVIRVGSLRKNGTKSPMDAQYPVFCPTFPIWRCFCPIPTTQTRVNRLASGQPQPTPGTVPGTCQAGLLRKNGTKAPMDAQYPVFCPTFPIWSQLCPIPTTSQLRWLASTGPTQAIGVSSLWRPTLRLG